MSQINLSDYEYSQMLERLNEICDWPTHPGLIQEAKRYLETGALTTSNRLSQIDRILNQNENLSYDEWATRMADFYIGRGELDESVKQELISIQPNLTDIQAKAKVSTLLGQPSINKDTLTSRLSLAKINALVDGSTSFGPPLTKSHRSVIDIFNRHSETVESIIRSTVEKSTKTEKWDIASEIVTVLCKKFDQYPEIDRGIVGQIFFML